MILFGLGCTIGGTTVLSLYPQSTSNEGASQETPDQSLEDSPEEENNNENFIVPDVTEYTDPNCAPGRLVNQKSFAEVKAELDAAEGVSGQGDVNAKAELVEGKLTMSICYSGRYTNDWLRIYVNGTLTHELLACDSNPDYSGSSNYTSFTFNSGDIIQFTDHFYGNYWFTHDLYSSDSPLMSYKSLYFKVGTTSVRSRVLIMNDSTADERTVTFRSNNGTFVSSSASDVTANTSSASTTLCCIGGRNFYIPAQTLSYPRYRGWATTRESWSGALVVSRDSNMQWYTAYNPSGRYGYDGTFTYNGYTYYYGGAGECMRLSGGFDTIKDYTHYMDATLEEAARRFVTYGSTYVYLDMPASGYLSTPMFDPKRDGYRFAGWYTATSGGTKVTGSTIVSNIGSDNITLYAQWTANSYTITYQPNGGSGSAVTQSVTYGSSYTTKPNTTFTKTGHYLAYWSTSSTSLSSYKRCNYSYTYNTAGNTTLYAYWLPNTYTVYLYDNDMDYNQSSASIYGDQISYIQVAYGASLWEAEAYSDEWGYLDYFEYMEISKTGCYFYGWGDPYNSGEVLTMDSTWDYAGGGELFEVWVPYNNTLYITPYYTTDGSTWNTLTSGTISITKSGDTGSESNVDDYYYGGDAVTSNSGTVSVTGQTSLGSFARGHSASITIKSVPTDYVVYGINSGSSASAPSGSSTKVTSGYISISTSSQTEYINLWLTKVQNPIKWGEDNVTYSTEAISGVTYGFTLNSSGYYESSNQGVNSSYSLTKFNFTKKAGQTTLTMNCINYGEPCCDYGILSNIDTTLALSNTADTTNVKKKFSSSESKATVQTVTYDISSLANNSSHYIYIKYRKDGSVHSNNDSLQFKPDFGTGYWYFEDGQYPQSYVGSSMNTTLNGLVASQLGSVVYTIKYNDGSTNKTLNAYTYNGTTYVQVTAPKTVTIDGVTFSSGSKYWFKSEPIKWRVSDFGASSGTSPSKWANYGQIVSNFTVVSHKILGAGAVLNGKMSQGYAYTSSSLYSNVNSLTATVYGSYAKSASWSCETFTGTSSQVGVSSANVTASVMVAGEANLDDNLTNYQASYTTFSALLLGKTSTTETGEYLLRNLGSNINSMRGINASGKTCNLWANKMNGYRLAVHMSKGMRV